MTGYAAAGDTWGMSGPTFLLLFVGAAGLILVGSAIHRRRVLAGPPDVQLTQLHPQQVAYLNGGGRLALYAALGSLRGSGVLAAGPGGTLAQTAPMPPGTTPLEQAVYNAAGKRLRTRVLPHDSWVRGALDQLREELERAGLAATAEARRAARAGALLMSGLALVGGVRLIAGVQNDRPVALLAVAEVAVVICAVVLLSRRPRQTAAGRRAVDELRRRNAHLAPAHRPAYATYGPSAAAMGVALYGGASLWAMDPGFAASAEINRESAGGSGWTGGSDGGSGGDSGGGDSGGGGCGGGGCGG